MSEDIAATLPQGSADASPAPPKASLSSRIAGRLVGLRRLGLAGPALALVVAILFHWLVPSWQPLSESVYTWVLVAILVGYGLTLVVGRFLPRVRHFVEGTAPIMTLFVLLLVLWDLLTAKTTVLPAPFFPTLDKIVDAYRNDWLLLLQSAAHSIRLLITGYLIGVIVGFGTGVLIGWSARANYWVMPFMRLIGPIPATAWIPIAMVVFPTSFWASVFLIALATWFPVAVMTSSGIANVPKSYFEVGRTLGADEKYLIRHIAVPAAFPTVFIGLFMGLAMSMLTLVVAELLGVEAGLGWYINWAKGWAQYGKVFASLLVIAVLFSAIIAAMFKAKDRLMQWQKGLVRW